MFLLDFIWFLKERFSFKLARVSIFGSGGTAARPFARICVTLNKLSVSFAMLAFCDDKTPESSSGHLIGLLGVPKLSNNFRIFHFQSLNWFAFPVFAIDVVLRDESSCFDNRKSFAKDMVIWFNDFTSEIYRSESTDDLLFNAGRAFYYAKYRSDQRHGEISSLGKPNLYGLALLLGMLSGSNQLLKAFWFRHLQAYGCPKGFIAVTNTAENFPD